MAEQTNAPARPAWLGGSAGVNTWRWTWKTADGYQETCESRGPTTEADMRASAQLILDGMRDTALRSGAADPGLSIVSVQPLRQDNSPVGAFLPDNRKPLAVDKFAKAAPESAPQ
jgi:hypothetical protein